VHTSETKQNVSLSFKPIIRANFTPNIITIETRLKLSLISQGVKVKVMDKSNDLVKVFSTITSTAKHFGLSNKALPIYLNNNKPYKGFILIPDYKDN